MDLSLIKSKTIWAALLLVVFGLLQHFGIKLPYDVILPALVAALGFGLRLAIKKSE